MSDANLNHKKVAETFKKILPVNSGLRLLVDTACGGNQRIPLFYTATKSKQAEYCNVDLLILKENKIRVIVEIEESNVKPTQICGKFLTSALSKYYIHYSEKDELIGMADSVFFIQIVDTSKLVSGKTAKLKQWRALEDSINRILPVKDSKILQYKLLTIDELEKLDSTIRSIK